MLETALAPIEQARENRVYEVGDRVLYIALYNNPGYIKPEDNVPGTVICAFEAGGMRIYRIELDIRWPPERHPQFKGEKIVVGNVYGPFLKPLPKRGRRLRRNN